MLDVVMREGLNVGGERVGWGWGRGGLGAGWVGGWGVGGSLFFAVLCYYKNGSELF